MTITSKSLYHTNIVFLFEEKSFTAPDNSTLAGLYYGEAAIGARFIDDPILQTKVLELPKMQLKVVVEPLRLIVEDLSQKEPQETSLISESLKIYQKLFAQTKLQGFGFNFDIYYRFNNVIPLKDLFLNFVDEKILARSDLRDFGTQFTLEKEGGRKKEQYFLKILAPLELTVHVNHHFPAQELPYLPPAIGESPETKNIVFPLQQLFEKCYNETDEVIQNLKF
ncbi:MAG: hypothetical protein N2259_00250 [Patescibacteria group bacterium]|nr:hypothetical protein [Patescibacteria group bacterium]